MQLPNFNITNKWIRSHRGHKNTVDPTKPYAFLIEKERMANGIVEDIATIFLTNRECPFRCLMCDLWINTTDETVPIGTIPKQIEYALENLPSVKHIKLYNSGNFFDKKAIPPGDYKAIIQLLHGFETLLVENHPKFINQNTIDFRDSLKADLQIAIGLETVHPEVLSKLNKQMTLDDFSTSVKFLNQYDILSRAFILLRPPFMNEEEGIDWAKNSIDFAFNSGIECCVIIPTRSGNGALNVLETHDYFQSPKIGSLEKVLEYGISLNKGRVFADLWDLEQFSDCEKCVGKRKDRMSQMNLKQVLMPTVKCSCGK